MKGAVGIHSCRAGEQGQKNLGKICRSQSTRKLVNSTDMVLLFDALHRKSYNDREDLVKVTKAISRIKKQHEKVSAKSKSSLAEFKNVVNYHNNAYFCARQQHEKNNNIVYERELESIVDGKPYVVAQSICDSFRWTKEVGIDDMGTLKNFFSSWNIDIMKTKKFIKFKSVWANTGYCPEMNQNNPCTGNNATTNDVTFAMSEPTFCIARGKESSEEVALLREGVEEEIETEGEDSDFVDVDINSFSDLD